MASATPAMASSTPAVIEIKGLTVAHLVSLFSIVFPKLFKLLPIVLG